MTKFVRFLLCWKMPYRFRPEWYVRLKNYDSRRHHLCKALSRELEAVKDGKAALTLEIVDNVVRHLCTGRPELVLMTGGYGACCGFYMYDKCRTVAIQVTVDWTDERLRYPRWDADRYFFWEGETSQLSRAPTAKVSESASIEQHEKAVQTENRQEIGIQTDQGADHDKASTSDEGVEPDADAGHRSVKEKVVLKEWMLNAWKGRCETIKEECVQYCIFITKPRDAKVMTNFEMTKRYEREFGCKVSMRSRKRNPGVGPGSQKDGENKQWVRASLHPIDYLQDHEERLRAISAAESHFDRFITRLVQEETFTRADMEAMALE